MWICIGVHRLPCEVGGGSYTSTAYAGGSDLKVQMRSLILCSYSHALSVARHIAALSKAFEDGNNKRSLKRGVPIEQSNQ